MIIDTFENASRYYMLHPSLEQAFDYLEEIDSNNFSAGTEELVEDHLYINKMVVKTKNEEDSIWESHTKNMDIHFMIEGEERMFYGDENAMKIAKQYDVEDDYTLFDGEGVEVTVPKNGFVIFFPGEIHKTLVHKGEPKTVKKAVVKLSVDW